MATNASSGCPVATAASVVSQNPLIIGSSSADVDASQHKCTQTSPTTAASDALPANAQKPSQPPEKSYEGKIAGLYDLERTLGSGHFAVVKLARHVFTREPVAVKIIDKTKLDEVSRAHLFQEVRCMKLVQHPHVVRLYEVIDTQTKLYLILELGDGGDLYDYIMKHDGGLSEPLACEYFRQIVRAISYCHELHVVHRDLKPENVVFFEKLGIVKLTDFGFSNKFYPGQKLETSCGSLEYMAPEILLGDSYDAPAVDVWSLGVILYMLVCGRPPFQERNDSETLTKIMDCRYSMPEHISPDCRDLIGTMLVVAPEKRATLQQIAEHRWLRAAVDAPDGGRPAAELLLPLVSRRQVTDAEHADIVARMVAGQIASTEQIAEALERNEYNHITATYFLLAECKLRGNRADNARKPFAPSFAKSRLLAGIPPKPPIPQKTAAPQLLRPPGTENAQSGRVRKCSIVQEEDDDEEDGETGECCAEDDEHDDVRPTPAEDDPSLNRRGSRSEGRLNITVAEIHAEAAARALAAAAGDVPAPVEFVERCKMRSESQSSSRSSSSRSTHRTNSATRVSAECGVAGGVSETIPELVESADVPTDDWTSGSAFDSVGAPSSVLRAAGASGSLPRASVLPGNPSLNEIHEEATDCGSSDSANTTPRSMSRVSLVHHQQAAHRHHHSPAVRRTKLHKTRTASCSSSDASDDDSENRKKRAHKIVGDAVSKPAALQRRDSYDDSSDSQDPGVAANSGWLNVDAAATQTTTGGSAGSDASNPSGGQQPRQQKATDADPKSGYRRHRTSHRHHRAGETRLRESQSLNRITEVQESDFGGSATGTATTSVQTMSLSVSVASSVRTQTATLQTATDSAPAGESPDVAPPSAQRLADNRTHQRGNSVTRMLHGLRNRHKYFDGSAYPPAVLCCACMKSASAGARTEPNAFCEHLAVDLAAADAAAGNAGGAGGAAVATSTMTKKLKILGRYFQVNSLLSNKF